MTARIEPQIVMETENVEIIKAMVRNGIGITIIPYQAVARDVAARPAVLRAHRGPLAGPRDRLGLSEDEPDAARGAGSDPGVRARPAEAQARAVARPSGHRADQAIGQRSSLMRSTHGCRFDHSIFESQARGRRIVMLRRGRDHGNIPRARHLRSS